MGSNVAHPRHLHRTDASAWCFDFTGHGYTKCPVMIPTRRQLLRGVLGAAQVAPPTLHADLLAFEVEWQKFLQHLYGCPTVGLIDMQCKPMLGEINYKYWERARKAAMRLFKLKEID